jgi:hypothetical protein
MHRPDGRILRKEKRPAEQIFHEGPPTVRRRRNPGDWRNPAGDWERTFCIITVDANDLVRKIHDRMPAMIDAADRQRWFDDTDDLLLPHPADEMSVIPA